MNIISAKVDSLVKHLKGGGSLDTASEYKEFCEITGDAVYKLLENGEEVCICSIADKIISIPRDNPPLSIKSERCFEIRDFVVGYLAAYFDDDDDDDDEEGSDE